MYFHKYELNRKGESYEVVLYIKPHQSLEEFAEEFGLTKRAEEDINRVAIGYVRKKFPTLRVKAIKVMMGGALVATIMFSGSVTQAFANEHETITQTDTPTETTTDDTTTESNLSTETEIETTVPAEERVAEETPVDGTTDTNLTVEEPITETTQEEQTPEEVPMDESGLVPGDFFYFVEAIAEKVQLALTFGDTAKAELISQFANERIAEANALFETGDTDGAIELLNKALESQELALDYVTEEDGLNETTPEGELPQEETTPNEEGDAIQEEETISPDETTGEDPASVVRDELQTQFGQNITVLLLAMEKVENPKAKAALAKNVEKAFAKMEKRLGKMNDIEERITTTIPVNENVDDLRKDIRTDQEDFEGDMKEVESEVETAGVGAPIELKKGQEKVGNVTQQTEKGHDKAQAGQQKGQEKVKESQSKAIKDVEQPENGQGEATQEKQSGQETAKKGKETGQEKQNEKGTTTPEKKNETKQENMNKGNAKAGTGAGNKVDTETEANADVEAGAEITPNSKEDQGKGNPGKGKNNNHR